MYAQRYPNATAVYADDPPRPTRVYTPPANRPASVTPTPARAAARPATLPTPPSASPRPSTAAPPSVAGPSEWKAQFPGLSAIIDRMVAASPGLQTISISEIAAALVAIGKGARLPAEVAASWDKTLRKVIGGGNAAWSMPAEPAGRSRDSWDRALRNAGATLEPKARGR